jgi:hypothetical protein
VTTAWRLSRSHFKIGGIFTAAALVGICIGSAQAENGKVRVNPYDKKPFTFKEPVPKKPTRLCMWREKGVVGYCPVGPATPIGSPCECTQTIEHAVTTHRGTVIAQQ